MGLEMSKHHSCYGLISNDLTSTKLHEDITYHGGIQPFAFLGKTAQRRAKRMKIWDS